MDNNLWKNYTRELCKEMMIIIINIIIIYSNVFSCLFLL